MIDLFQRDQSVGFRRRPTTETCRLVKFDNLWRIPLWKDMNWTVEKLEHRTTGFFVLIAITNNMEINKFWWNKEFFFLKASSPWVNPATNGANMNSPGAASNRSSLSGLQDLYDGNGLMRRERNFSGQSLTIPPFPAIFTQEELATYFQYFGAHKIR